AEETFSSQRLVILLGGVERHFDDALHLTVCRGQRADLDAEPPCDGRTHLSLLEDLAFDFARLDHLLGQRLQHCLAAQGEDEGFHPPNEPPLAVPERGQRAAQGPVIPMEFWPIGELIDVFWHNIRISRGDYAI